MTDEEAATKVSPEVLAAYRHVESLEIGHVGPYGSCMYYGHQVREAFLAGVEHGRKELNDVIAARQKDADMAAHYYKKCQELQTALDELQKIDFAEGG